MSKTQVPVQSAGGGRTRAVGSAAIKYGALWALENSLGSDQKGR
jgi:hypothetical protein